MGRIGILVINLGTPDGPDPASVRRYLAEFLSDPRVVEIPQLLWQPILRGPILLTRPKKSAHAYRQVWMEEGSPLAVYTRDTARALQDRMGAAVMVDWAMRYGNPAIDTRLAAMIAAGCDRILLAPLYPQYCAATTATAFDAAYAALAKMRAQPAVRTLPPYYADPAYIEALRASTQAQLAALDFAPDLLIASFHGMPERTRQLGDPYRDQCVESARLLGEALGREVRVTFQSRFGRAKWLGPATDAVLRQLPSEGVGNVAVLTPGFSADCLETLEEIALRGKEDFISFGGNNFVHLSCLNASPDAMNLYENLARRELAGWLER
ncbi:MULTISPECIES: ferrochelatase [unclassified Sphingobium]|uniref:ferrochelatase n=1 Tax=unclassified Sphingobium TaxID=2611147 RepID=UPI00076FF722|nr:MULTISPECIES: ferrochelatase [unclassified Sphingobium]AMK24439.1 ferrochelatase [Sphingobium sp. TKS]NML88692.1 ferrochelatase [Sphingobium sp. TB-6]